MLQKEKPVENEESELPMLDEAEGPSRKGTRCDAIIFLTYILLIDHNAFPHVVNRYHRGRNNRQARAPARAGSIPRFAGSTRY